MLDFFAIIFSSFAPWSTPKVKIPIIAALFWAKFEPKSEKMIANRSLDGIHIFFPDPWHKKRHNKRRLIKADFLNKLALKLKEQAYIHIATDWEEYAHWILDESTQCKNLCLKGNEFHNKPDYRPYTKYEKRGVNLGHKVWDIIFLKC